MMADLFDDDTRMTPVKMDDADVSFLKRLPFEMNDEQIFNKLRDETKWLHEEIVVWGKKHYQPRLTAWYGDPGRSYSYSGTVMFPLPWTNILLALRQKIELITSAKFNSVLLNFYRDNNDRMGFHSDNEPSLGPEPIIASLSYGATRTLLFKHKRDLNRDLKPVPLTSGSLLLMKGQTQKNWKHGINKEAKRCGPRINLTFRNILK